MKNLLVLYGGNIVTDSQILRGKSVIIKDGVICDIVANELIDSSTIQYIDCQNKYIMPGLIDIHSDSIEKVIVPRKGIKFDLTTALFEMDRQLAHQGITTIYHSLSMARTTICNNVRTIRPEDIFKLCDLLAKQNGCPNSLLVNHRIHIRLELNTTDVYDKIIEYINNGLIHELSFMDHSPGQGQYKKIATFKKVIEQQYGKIPRIQQNEIIKVCLKKEKLDNYRLENLINLSNKMNIPIAYHDVESTEQVDWMANKNIQICEFPLSSKIARYAIDNGLHCVVGAPNVIMGKSHYNNASAVELLSQGRANILCSDYFTPLLLHAVFKLNRELDVPLYKAVSFATINPAIAMKISPKYGSIAKGKCADIIIVDAGEIIPKVDITIVNGTIKSLFNASESLKGEI